MTIASCVAEIIVGWRCGNTASGGGSITPYLATIATLRTLVIRGRRGAQTSVINTESLVAGSVIATSVVIARALIITITAITTGTGVTGKIAY